jgi:FkbM family methyltransferase
MNLLNRRIQDLENKLNYYAEIVDYRIIEKSHVIDIDGYPYYNNDMEVDYQLYNDFDFSSYSLRSFSQLEIDFEIDRLINANWKSDEINFHGILKTFLAYYWKNNLPISLIDVGSNIGTESIPIADYIRKMGMENTQLHTFEPGHSYKYLEANVYLNQLENIIKLNNLGVSDINSVICLNIVSGYSVGTSTLKYFDMETQNHYAGSKLVRTITLQNYLKNIEGDFLIKIDTEGLDDKVLLGMGDLLSVRAPLLQVEFSPQTSEWLNKSSSKLIEILSQAGYKIFNILGGDSGGGFVFDQILYSQQVVIDFIKRVKSKFAYSYTNLLAIHIQHPIYDFVVKKMLEYVNK